MGEEVDIFKLIAGLGAFLFGMLQLENGLENLAGPSFRRFLRQTTSEPHASVFVGIIATALVQSSSLVNLIVLAFVGAGIIPLVNAIGVVIGSNLGTTLTGWIVATIGFKLDLQAISLPLFGLGGLGYSLLKNKWQSLSQLLIGFSLLLIGLDLMKTSVIILATQFDFQSFVDFPILFFLFVGLILTAVIQSSSATMMITLSALHAQIIPLPAAAAMIIGADLGTTSTVLLGSFQGAVSKQRVAMAQVLFNLSIDITAFIFIFPALKLITGIVGLSDPLYTLVMFHSLFNLAGVIFFIPFIKPLSRFLETSIKDDISDIRQYISEVPANVTDAALEAMKLESRRLLQMTTQYNLYSLKISKKEFVKNTSELTLEQTGSDIDHKNDYENIKRLEGEIVRYAIEVQSSNLDPEEAKHIESLLSAVRHAVYSAKSLKDIRADLNLFFEMDNKEVLIQSERLKQNVADIYSTAIGLIDKHHDFTYFSEELEVLQSQLKLFHHEFLHEIYQNRRDEISEVELSTLLNVNRELRESCEAVLKGILLAWREYD